MTPKERQTVIDALALGQAYADDLDHEEWRKFDEALAIMRREREPVAYTLQSTHDGSILFQILAPVGWHNFDETLGLLKDHPWVKNERAEIVPLYKD